MRRKVLHLVALGTALLVVTAASGAGFGHSPKYTWPGALTLTVGTSPSGAGWIRSTPYLIDCPTDCVRPLSVGSSLVLSANITPGFTFTSWSGTGCAGQTNPCTLKAAADTTITANYSGSFDPTGGKGAQQLKIAVSSIFLGGTVTVSTGGSCSEGTSTTTTCTFYKGTGETEVLTANGPFFLGWGGDCDTTTPTTCTVKMDGWKSITALFL
jgi:hypothetical protein